MTGLWIWDETYPDFWLDDIPFWFQIPDNLAQWGHLTIQEFE
jgi:hypothetical protein